MCDLTKGVGRAPRREWERAHSKDAKHEARVEFSGARGERDDLVGP
jgi:hypothetical protein